MLWFIWLAQIIPILTMDVERMGEQPMIKVVVRKRPLNRKEAARGEQDVIDISSPHQVAVRQQKLKVDLTRFVDEHHFHFDQAIDQTTPNSKVYADCVRPLVHCCFRGAKVTCFAYGQTGSGKTFTMSGDPESGILGMYYLGAEDIFTTRDQLYPALEVHLSFYQIYCSKLFDLLNGREQLQAREDARQNVNIIGLTVKKVASPKEFMAAVSQGSGLRITSQNSTNADSSRSHAILQIELRLGKKSQGKLTFIDLAGCERGADTLEQNKQTKIDGAEINKSLLALKECIRSLDQGKNHTPFRGSKLTMVLKDSFTGFCKTLMIANIAPGSGSCENTLNTLRYADRVKSLKKGSEKEQPFRDQIPRNFPSRQQTCSESQEDERHLNADLVKKAVNPPAPKGKRPKYIFKDENERVKGEQTPLRKLIMTPEYPPAEPLRNMNHFPKRRESRNKSLVVKERLVHKSREESEIFQNNLSLVIKEGVGEGEWAQAVRRFRRWSPSPHNFGEMSQLFEQMVALMMREEVELAEAHRSFLLQEESSQKDLSSAYRQTQADCKNNSEMIDWANRLSDLLHKKGGALRTFQLRAQDYQQHLKEHEFCEGRLLKAAEMLSDPETHHPRS